MGANLEQAVDKRNYVENELKRVTNELHDMLLRNHELEKSKVILAETE